MRISAGRRVSGAERRGAALDRTPAPDSAGSKAAHSDSAAAGVAETDAPSDSFSSAPVSSISASQLRPLVFMLRKLYHHHPRSPLLRQKALERNRKRRRRPNPPWKPVATGGQRLSRPNAAHIDTHSPSHKPNPKRGNRIFGMRVRFHFRRLRGLMCYHNTIMQLFLVIHYMRAKKQTGPFLPFPCT